MATDRVIGISIPMGVGGLEKIMIKIKKMIRIIKRTDWHITTSSLGKGWQAGRPATHCARQKGKHG
jgi:hypothetical protein